MLLAPIGAVYAKELGKQETTLIVMIAMANQQNLKKLVKHFT
jgi:hypothetical protein